MKAPTGRCRIVLSILLVFFLVTVSRAQLNLSGSWEFDKAHSSPETDFSKYEGKVVRTITQTASTITYKDTYTHAGSPDWSTTDEQFALDKEKIEKHGKDEVKKFTRWSADKKSLTLTYQNKYYQEGVAKEMVIAETYTLSDNGKTLVINRSFKNPVTGEMKTVSTFKKRTGS